jgi:mannose-6-phosphate isomerase
MLYPLKFTPLLKERIWGGDMLSKMKNVAAKARIGESWELSGVPGDVSVVSGGPLKGNDLNELSEVYMGDLVGEHVFGKYGEQFPLLIKLIDARDVLSIQVHPDDKLAARRHNSYGKTEMWYVVDADPGASLYVGFKRKTSREEYLAAVEAGTLPELLRRVEVKAGDAFFIPAGAIHAIGAGLVIAEIQQTSDITYRVDDWGRVDDHGHPRELHTELAVDAIDFSAPSDYNITVAPVANTPVTMERCPYFTTNLLRVSGECTRDYAPLDSFVIYICIDGELSIVHGDGTATLAGGQTALLPAALDEATLRGDATLLEVYIG